MILSSQFRLFLRSDGDVYGNEFTSHINALT
jgi:hypothetical protein